MSQRGVIAWAITPNRKPYLFTFIVGIVAGLFAYHLFGSHIESIWPKIPYLNKIHSGYGSEVGYQ